MEQKLCLKMAGGFNKAIDMMVLLIVVGITLPLGVSYIVQSNLSAFLKTVFSTLLPLMLGIGAIAYYKGRS